MHGSLFRNRGIAFIEVLISLVIGLVVVLVIFQVASNFEGFKRTTTEGNSAQDNGMFAIFTLENEIKNSGWGVTADVNKGSALTSTALLGCDPANTWAFNNNQAAQQFSLMPVLITDGGVSANNSLLSDNVTIFSGTAQSGNTSIPISQATDLTTNTLTIESNAAFNQNDIIVVASPGPFLPSGAAGDICTYSQVTGVANPALGVVQLTRQTNAYNAPLATPYWQLEDTSAGKIYNMGTAYSRSYSVVSNNNGNGVVLSSTDFGDPNGALPVADNIVNIQAQYGFSNGSKTQNISNWLDATGANAAVTVNHPPVAAGMASVTSLSGVQVANIKAIRIFVVARSPLREKLDANGNCNATPVAPRPSWSNTPVDLSFNNTFNNWQCYRYKTYETVVPLRNIIWGNL